MLKPRFVLSPCGTSLYTNKSSNEIRGLVNQYANAKNENDIPASQFQALLAWIDQRNKELIDAETEKVTSMSAELNCIVKLYEGHVTDNNQDFHQLLCTDTWIGELSATAEAQWLRSKGLIVDVKRHRDLQTSDRRAFQLAMSDLVTWCEEEVNGFRDKNYHIIFNLTGGFKSVQGFLQTLAMFYADESIYIFETGKEILHIPKLPVEMAADVAIRENLLTIRRLSLGLDVPQPSATIAETLLFEIDGQRALSEWGNLIWQQTRKKLYRTEIFPPPSDYIIFAKSFKTSTENLSADRIAIINERIDDLAIYIENNNSLRRLDFKPLQGNPKPPSTHEMDAWADLDAKRIYGHWEQDKFILDRLDKKLS